MRHSMNLKAFLMDQSIIAGLGNIYSDEILWEAGLRYDRLSNSLSAQEMRRLYRALRGLDAREAAQVATDRLMARIAELEASL